MTPEVELIRALAEDLALEILASYETCARLQISATGQALCAEGQLLYSGTPLTRVLERRLRRHRQTPPMIKPLWLSRALLSDADCRRSL